MKPRFALVGAALLLASVVAYGESQDPRRWKVTRKSQRDDLARLDAECRQLEGAYRAKQQELGEVVAEIRSDLGIPVGVALHVVDGSGFSELAEIPAPVAESRTAVEPGSASR